jgi:dTDP-4-amino-4,6-dideoxygalactose transaminase
MIPLFKLHKPKNIGQVLEQVFDSGFLTEGEYSDRFELEFGKFIGNENMCLVNSCTSALALAAHVIGIKPGDEVITTAMTCMATNEPFFNLGAKLVFADVNKENGNIDVKDIERKITPKTKAIVVVHWAGLPVELDEIHEIAKRHSIKVVEDAAHALRAEYKGKRIGNHSDFVCFSFQAIKHLTTADGGAIACKSKDDAVRIRKLRWFGLDRGIKGMQRWTQDIPESGFKYHMNNLNAAIGLEQLKYIDDLINKHIENGIYYNQNINNPKIQKIPQNEYSQSAYWMYSLLVEDRTHFQKYLSENGIGSDYVHVRNDQYSVFKDFKTQLSGMDYFESRLMNIPVGWWLTKEDRDKIVSVVNQY